ncbi:unnamed protein product [Candidula unifasciata]|uniref:Rab-GAP TBC domain-containing protein n=1 Tax=Candidula unifasciata TaxID=100452 RepID=A0A8S3YLJ3_9EUPU|nr:unnamed protein product [Candidula unifasciata]
MAGFYNLDHKEVIRIKVKKCDGRMQPEYKKFSIDPQITSFEMLQGILARAFDINSDFTISYLARDSEGQAVYLSMLSDWDMDAAFQCAADPCLKLKVDLRPFEEEMEDWDVIAPTEVPQHRISSLLDKNSILGSITGTITQNLGRTVNSMQRAMGLKQAENEVIKPLKAAMSDMEFHSYLDNAGFMVRPNEFRLAIYQGGIEPSLRRVAWRHLLNIYPADMSGRDRFDYMKRKEEEYRKLRDEWREKFWNNTATEEVKYIAGMVKKDVLRTDRSHGFYAGNDENENTLSLFHLLVTYALTHPDISYCQGMSDLASPLLVTQKDEGQAYICFCALMNRLRENFTTEGSAIMTKFRHLSDLLHMCDPALHAHLAQSSASDMLFCYRWFLLEFKREFPFTDALYVLEVMWATLPPNPPEHELALVDPDYSSRLLSSSPCSPTFSFQHAMYAKLLAMRRVGARQKVSQPNLPVTSLAAQTGTNDTLNIESTAHFGNHCTIQNTVSYDTSPGDGEDRGTDFPEVDNLMTRSMQQKSNSIDQVLQEGSAASQDLDGNFVKGLRDGNDEDESVVCNGDSRSTDSIKPFVKANSSYDTSDYSFHTDLSTDGQLRHAKSDDMILSIDNPQLQCRDSSSDLEADRSSSLSSVTSESSEAGDKHIQFALSLDSNTNYSSETSDTTADLTPSSINSESDQENTISVQADVHSNDSSNTDSNTGLFQSMKRLLASPKRRPFNSTWNDSVASPHKSAPLVNRQKYPPAVISQGIDKIEDITRNSSDSHISETLETSEAAEISGFAVSSSTKLPVRDLSKLPPPQEFGAGNPFLMFMSLTLLTQHREHIISQGMCYEEIAMHFDRLVRRHNANRVLHLARQMYTEYLRAQQANLDRDKDSADMGPSC